MQTLSGLVCAVTRSAGTESVASVAKCVGLINVLRHSGYIVQPFVLGQDDTVCFDILQRMSGRRVVTLEPWLHAGSTLQHVFWNACEGSDVAVFLIPEGILGADTFVLPSWAQIKTELLEKLHSPVLLCTSSQDSLEDIKFAAETLPPSLLLHVTASSQAGWDVPAGAALNAAQLAKSDCRLLGSLPEAAFESAVATLQSQQSSAEPLRAVVAAAIKHRTLVSVMGKARPQEKIPQPTQMGLTPRRQSGNRVRIAVGLDMGLTPSQFQGNLNVLESLGCELTNVSMASATCLPPDISGLYLSATLTPATACALSMNVSMRMSVAAFAAAGGVIYGEEAGLAYLASSVRFGADTFGMAGVFPMHVIMHEEQQAHGYVRLRVQQPANDQQPLMEPGEWLRGVADTTLEVREEVTTRGLGSRTRNIGDIRVSQLFDAVLVDSPHPSGTAGPNKTRSSNVASASPVHGFDTVREGYQQAKVAATLVHVCFASQVNALKPMVSTCATLDAQQLATRAAQHITSQSQRSSTSSRTSPLKERSLMPHSGSEGCLTQLPHPLLRLSDEHANNPTSPQSITPSASAVSLEFHQSPGLTDTAAKGRGHARSRSQSGAAGPSPVASSKRTGSEGVRAWGMQPDSGAAHMGRPSLGASGIAQRWGSTPEGLFQSHQHQSLAQSHSSSGSGNHSTMRSAAQLWMPPQPLPRARVMSARDLTAFDGGVRLTDVQNQRPTRYIGGMDCAAAAIQRGPSRPNSEEHPRAAPAAAATCDISSLSKAPSCSSFSSNHSLGVHDRMERTASNPCQQHTGIRSQIVALSPSIADILSHMGLSSVVGGVPAECLSVRQQLGDSERNRPRSLARKSLGSSSSGAAAASGALRSVISLAPNLTDPSSMNGSSNHAHLGGLKPSSKQQQRHRRMSSGDLKGANSKWRNFAQRASMDIRDWLPLHVVHTDQIAALAAPMVLTWEPERQFSARRGGVLPLREAAHACVLDHLRHMDALVDIVTLPAPRSIGDMYSTIQCMGTILRATGAAEAAAAQMQTGLHRLAQLCFRPTLHPESSTASCSQPQQPQQQQQRKVMMLRSAAPYVVAGGWMPELVRMCGAVNCCTFPGEGALAVEWTDIAAQDPDVIVVIVEVVGVESAALELAVLAEEPGWWSLKATKNREVYIVDAAHLMQIGPGTVDAAETVAMICRPDLHDELSGLPPRGDRVLKLEMTAAQRCRPSLLPSFFKRVPWAATSQEKHRMASAPVSPRSYRFHSTQADPEETMRSPRQTCSWCSDSCSDVHL